jgi:hypothetical protein
MSKKTNSKQSKQNRTAKLSEVRRSTSGFDDATDPAPDGADSKPGCITAQVGLQSLQSLDPSLRVPLSRESVRERCQGICAYLRESEGDLNYLGWLAGRGELPPHEFKQDTSPFLEQLALAERDVVSAQLLVFQMQGRLLQCLGEEPLYGAWEEEAISEGLEARIQVYGEEAQRAGEARLSLAHQALADRKLNAQVPTPAASAS